MTKPGMGFFPIVLGGVFILLCIPLVKSSMQQNQKTTAEEIASGNPWKISRRPLLIIAALAGYVLLLDYLGYFLSTFLLLLAGGFVVDSRNRVRLAVVAFIAAVAAYLVFAFGLQVPLPAGILPFMEVR